MGALGGSCVRMYVEVSMVLDLIFHQAPCFRANASKDLQRIRQSVSNKSRGNLNMGIRKARSVRQTLL